MSETEASTPPGVGCMVDLPRSRAGNLATRRAQRRGAPGSEKIVEAQVCTDAGQRQRAGHNLVALCVPRSARAPMAHDAVIDEVEDPVLGNPMLGVQACLGLEVVAQR